MGKKLYPLGNTNYLPMPQSAVWGVSMADSMPVGTAGSVLAYMIND